MFVPTDWSKVSDEVLVAELISAACAGNEYDNRDNVRDAQTEVLKRLRRRAKFCPTPPPPPKPSEAVRCETCAEYAQCKWSSSMRENLACYQPAPPPEPRALCYGPDCEGCIRRGDVGCYPPQPAPPPDEDNMACPNCCTPWKCNGPHQPAPPKDAP